MTFAAALLDNAAGFASSALDIDVAGVGCNAALVIDTGLIGGCASVAIDFDATLGLGGTDRLAIAETGAAGDPVAMLVGGAGTSTFAMDDLPAMGAALAADCGAIAAGIDMNRIAFDGHTVVWTDIGFGAILRSLDASAIGVTC